MRMSKIVKTSLNVTPEDVRVWNEFLYRLMHRFDLDETTSLTIRGLKDDCEKSVSIYLSYKETSEQREKAQELRRKRAEVLEGE